MRDLFPGHFKPTEELVKNDWKEFIFVFDTNVLLNIYRYSESTRLEYLGLLDKIKERSWLPNRVVEEYLNNRLTTIAQQEKAYNTMLTNISSLKKELDNNRQHPFASKETMALVDEAFDKLTAEFTNNKNTYTTKIHDDEIKDRYLRIYNGRVGAPISSETLETIFSEGEDRYKKQVPPGYKDAIKQVKDSTTDDLKRKFGDLIIWKEIIQYSSSLDKGVIFVTDDRKEDWWEIFNGKTIGPRPELIKEFKENTNNRIHIYKSDRFLELARVNLGEEVSSSIVNEIRDSNNYEKTKDLDILIKELSYNDIICNKLNNYTKKENKQILEENIDYESWLKHQLDEEDQSNIFDVFEEISIDNRIELLLLDITNETRRIKELQWQKKMINNSNKEVEKSLHSDKTRELIKTKNHKHMKEIEAQENTIKKHIYNMHRELDILQAKKSRIDNA